ncbi:MAG: preprotein translocase subunit SecE [Patescibacteria group bacterium]
MKNIIQFIKEAIHELGKVTWPTRRDVLRMTVGVLIFSAAFALFIGLVDIGISKGMEGALAWLAQRSQSSASSASSSPIQIQPGDIQVDTTPAQ